MQNRRHVGGQPTSQSIKITQSSGKISVTNPLVGLDNKLNPSGHTNMHDEQSNDYLEVYFYSQ